MARMLLNAEKNFIRKILKITNQLDKSSQLSKQLMVEDIGDEMGSFKFIYNDQETSENELCGVIFRDVDDIPVYITLYVDDNGRLCEVDIWKANSEPLCHVLDTNYKIIEVVN